MDKTIIVLSVECTAESKTIGKFLISEAHDYKVKIFYNSLKMEFNMNSISYPSFDDIRQRVKELLL